MKDGEAVIAAAKAADEAAKAKKIFDPLHWREDFILWKDQPQLVTPEGLSLGKPHTLFEIRAQQAGLRDLEKQRLLAERHGIMGAADEIAAGEKRIGKFIDNTTDPITKAEKVVVDDLVEQGKTVERIPKDPKAIDKSPDFKVDGVKTELKTLENANTNTGMKRVQQGFVQEAENVIIDARNSGLTRVQAEEIISRAKGKYPNGQLPGTVEIWIDGQVVVYP